MRIDSIGMVVPDDPPPGRRPLWYCPDCEHPTWPATDPFGRPYARRCVPCQIDHDQREGLTQ